MKSAFNIAKQDKKFREKNNLKKKINIQKKKSQRILYLKSKIIGDKSLFFFPISHVQSCSN